MTKSRKFERHERRLEVLVLIDGRAFHGTTRNLSYGGAFIEVKLDVTAIRDRDVALHFFVPGRKKVIAVSTRGNIRWLEGDLPESTGFGVQFDNLTLEQYSMLHSLFTMDTAQIPSVVRSHRRLISAVLNSWVENGEVPEQAAEEYKARLMAG